MALTVSTVLRVTFEHDGVDTTGYELKVNGDVVESKLVSELVDGRMEFEYVPERSGVLAFQVFAYRDPEPSNIVEVVIP